MPIPTPLHSRTGPLCQTLEWRDWSGYFSAVTYEPNHEVEYYAVRNAAGLIDVSPLFKYEITGPDAERLVDRVMTRDIAKCRVGQVMYSPWCDDDGKVIDDGTISRLGENHFRVTAADPSLRWFQDVGYGMRAEVRDVSASLAALALQGPNSRAILQQVFRDTDFNGLPYYHLLTANFQDQDITVTRTGYTGDLGYEIWINSEHAPMLWDRLVEVGRNYGLKPVGLGALDMLRVEAGLLLIEVDYTSSPHARIPSQKSSPFELGLGWAVSGSKGDFVGKRALETDEPTPRQLAGLVVDWLDLEKLFGQVTLPPQVAGRATRIPVPLYANGRHVGQATSMVFSPILKKYIALGTIQSDYAQLGRRVGFEVTVEYERLKAKATVSKPPFYDPEHKRSVIGG